MRSLKSGILILGEKTEIVEKGGVNYDLVLTTGRIINVTKKECGTCWKKRSSLSKGG